MDFIDKLFVPSSSNTLVLLKYLLTIALVIYSVYLGVLLTSSLLSLIFKIIYVRKKNEKFLKISKDYIDLITPNKTMAFGLGFVPFLSIILIYIQILQKAESDIIFYFIASFILFIPAVVLLYLFKHTIIERSTGDGTKLKAGGFSNWVFGFLGLIFLLVSSRIFIANVTMAADSSNWDTVLSLSALMFNIQTILHMLQFVTISIVITALAFIVKYFYWDKPEEIEIKEDMGYARDVNKWLALVFAFIQPLILVIDFLTIPKEIMMTSEFIYGIFALFSLLILLHMTYAAIRWDKHGSLYFSFSFYLILITFTFLILKEQSAFALSSKQQVLQLASGYDKFEEAILEKEGKSAPKIDGGEIYKTKCIACHRFDEKLVGPPHKFVMLKYLNDKEGMVKFILNPVKVDPVYPPMPNQGMTLQEAQAVVDYMYKEYGDKLK
jgi:cytochrome c